MNENLLQETLEFLKEHKLDETEILFCGGGNYKFSWEKFKELANQEYDSDYGCAEVAMDLKIFGKDWWLTRREYDGAESWKLNSMTRSLPYGEKIPERIIGKYWPSLANLHDPECIGHNWGVDE
jgi:hypothetical protein